MDQAEALFKQALDRHNAGDLAAAEALYRSALEADPALVPARVNLSMVLRSSARLSEALGLVSVPAEATQATPLHNERALALLGLHRYEEAEAALREALQGERESAVSHYNLGQLLLSQGRHDEAVASMEEAVARDPREARYHDGLGVACLALGDLGRALRCLLRAIEIDPRHASAWCHLGDVDRARQAFASAQIAYGCALTLEPGHAMALWGQVLAWLSAGDFERGWPAYERRFECGLVKLPAVRARPWGDEPIVGRRVLVLGEQGVGDEIMFARFALSLAEAGAHPVLTCDVRLAALFRRSLPGVAVEGVRGDPAEGELPADLAAPAGSLAGRYWRDGLSAMFETAYLKPDPARLAAWHERLAALGPGLKVGISWRGGKDALVRSRRSTPLAAWRTLLSVPGALFVNLQYGDCAAEIAQVRAETGIEVADWPEGDPLVDLDEFSAKLAALDLVVSVDNSTVHLAGALGRPTFALLSAAADWRWLSGRDDTPWYPSVRLFRQPESGDWPAVFDQAAAALRMLAREVAPTPAAPKAEPAPALPRPALPRLAFLNDTSDWYHFGCTATSTALKQGFAARGYEVRPVPTSRLLGCAPAPERLSDYDDPAFFERFSAANRDLIAALEAADLMVINGEGSLHGTGAYPRTLLYVAYCAATRLGRKVQIVNHSCYPESAARISDALTNALYKKVYETLDFIAVREPLSAEILDTLGLVPTRSFDCLPLYVADHYRGHADRRRSGVVIAGSVAWRREALPAFARLIELARDRREPVTVLIGAQANPARDDRAFVEALRAAQGSGWALIEARSLGAWLDAIAGARLLVSGRFHHTIAALCLGTPFVALESNTPKMQALLDMTGQAPPLGFDDAALADALASQATERLERGEPLLAREAIAQLENLARQNFAGLDGSRAELRDAR
ncbi:MAG: tetratricopeptide repeat protein [Alphaproteobacteria bacterium]